MAETNFRNAIDSINKTKLQRVAFGIVDLVMNGYIHAWKLDIGPAVNWIRYNSLEGFRPTIALRTGQKMMENMNDFTIINCNDINDCIKKYKENENKSNNY